MSTAFRSRLYHGRVVHHRSRPVKHRFAYRVFMLLLDLDELPTLAEKLRWFSLNGSGPVSFRDRDHGPDGQSIRDWVDAELGAAGFDPRDLRVSVLCYPRLFGYVFNPLSVYFCHQRESGRLRAILYEVHNTFGGRHAYVLPVGGPVSDEGAVDQNCSKDFFVSPFIDMAGRYRFRLRDPGASAALLIEEKDADGVFFRASFSGRSETLSDRSLIGAIVRYPLMTYRVFGAIHWQALRLWLKGAPFLAPRRARQAVVRGNLRDAG